VRAGDLLAPVIGETFGLVVANPPFVISPTQRYLFRDGAHPLDELYRTLVRSVPGHLEGGGHFQLLASWAHVEGEDWRDRLAGWFDGTGCDALVLAREALDPSAHAANWLRQTEPAVGWEPEYDRWMAYYERHRVEAVGLGLITMRKRREGDGWFRVEQAEQDFVMPCGDHLGAAFELADFLESHDGDDLYGAVRLVRQRSEAAADRRAVPGGRCRRGRCRHRRRLRRDPAARGRAGGRRPGCRHRPAAPRARGPARDPAARRAGLPAPRGRLSLRPSC
jgi:hypothetical protein